MKDYLNKIKQLELQIEHLNRHNQKLEEKLNAALDGTGLCLWEHHLPSGKLTIFNMEWGKMLGYQASELEATYDVWKSKLHPDDFELAVGAFESHVNGEADTYKVVHRMIHNDGSHSWVSDRGRIVEYDAHGIPLRIMGTHIDITNEKRYELELARLATLDPLTNLLNRKAFQAEFDKLNNGENEQVAALMFIDLDNFKTVNDHFGHTTGDALLNTVAQWLNTYAPSDATIARLGGDEFLLLFASSDEESLDLFTHRLLLEVKSPIELENGLADIGFSIGICQFKTAQHTFETLYDAADQAMYQVKKKGKNGVQYIQL